MRPGYVISMIPYCQLCIFCGGISIKIHQYINRNGSVVNLIIKDIHNVKQTAVQLFAVFILSIHLDIHMHMYQVNSLKICSSVLLLYKYATIFNENMLHMCFWTLGIPAKMYFHHFEILSRWSGKTLVLKIGYVKSIQIELLSP